MTHGRGTKYQLSQKQHDFFSQRIIRVDKSPLSEAPPRCPVVKNNRWLLVTVAPNCEALAVNKLKEARFPAWYPMGVFWRTAGFVKRRRLAALFPGYLFIGGDGFDDDKPRPNVRLLEVDHVSAIVSDWDGYLLSHGKIVARLDEAMASGLFDYTTGINPKTGKPEPKFKPGDNVRVEDGPFASFPGVVEDATDEKLIKILVSIFGRPTPVMLEPEQISAIA